jgi:ATP-binding cassette subfamily C protein CydC
VLVPVLVALTRAGIGFFVFTALYDLTLALLLLAMLLLAGVLLPWLSRRLGAKPGRRMVEAEAELRQARHRRHPGLSELLVYGAADAHARRLDAASRALIADQDRMSRIAGIGQGAVG